MPSSFISSRLICVKVEHPYSNIDTTAAWKKLAILANTPNQAKTLLHSLERAAACFGLHVNAHKTEYMCYNQTGDISTLDGTSLKLVDKFTYPGSSVSSNEKGMDTRLVKAWTAIDTLSIIWKSDLTQKSDKLVILSSNINWFNLCNLEYHCRYFFSNSILRKVDNKNLMRNRYCRRNYSRRPNFKFLTGLIPFIYGHTLYTAGERF